MKKIFSILLAGFAMVSCVDTVILPDNKTIDEDFWQTKSEVEAVMGSAYAQLRTAECVRNMIIWGDFRSDELVVTSDLRATDKYYNDLQQMYSFNYVTESPFNTWAPFYSAINYCNLVLEKAEGVMAIDPNYMPGDYQANRAQALALRAFCYFYLTRVFHDIPVTPHAYLNSSDDLNVPQSTPDSVLTMCIEDLKEAYSYAVPGNTYAKIEGEEWRDKAFLNKDGISAVLADIYLWRGSINRDGNDYQACIEWCDSVIAAKKRAYEANPKQSMGRRPGMGQNQFEPQDYYLSTYENMYNDIFVNQNADESIFELQFRRSNNFANTGLTEMYYNLTGSYGCLKASKPFGTQNGSANSDAVWKNNVDLRFYEYLFNAGEAIDQFNVRKFVASQSRVLSQSSDLSAASAPDRNRSVAFPPTWIFYRLTDVMLMKAEALVQLYNMGGKGADDTRNEEAFEICRFINSRALSEDNKGMELKYSVYQNSMEELVLQERARELCFEGKRWYDLMRYNYRHTDTQADLTKKLTEKYVNSNYSGFYDLALRKYTAASAMRVKMRDERYLYMPIAQDEIELNSSLNQNPVYKSSAKY